MGGDYSIKLPPFLTVEIESESAAYHPGAIGYWRAPIKQFIVLKFGYSEIGRWEWQSDRPVDQRVELEEDDITNYTVTDFVAEKLREKLFPEEPKED